MWNGTEENEENWRWGFDILKQNAEGKNYYTGGTGTRISFFSQSVYAGIP
ncbi:hypothetical protein ES708_17974 [subsurface metagenome]